MPKMANFPRPPSLCLVRQFFVEKLQLGTPKQACGTLRASTNRIHGLFWDMGHRVWIPGAKYDQNRPTAPLKMRKYGNFAQKWDSNCPQLIPIVHVSRPICPHEVCKVPLVSTDIKLWSGLSIYTKIVPRPMPKMPTDHHNHPHSLKNRHFLSLI